MEKTIYHIDHGSTKFSVLTKEAPYGFFWCIAYARPPVSFMLKDEDVGVVWFENEEACLNARIERLKCALDAEISAKNKKFPSGN